MTPPVFSIVIPCHNEAAYLPDALDALYDALDRVPAETEVIIAENGSTDGTADAVRAAAQRHPGLGLIELPDPDYGAAMREGFLQSRGEWAVNFDIDYFSGAFLLNVLESGDDSDLVLASKRAVGSRDKRSRFRRLATLVFNLLLRTLFGSQVSDTHGMKAIRRRVVDDIAPRVASTQDLFDTELVIRAERAGYRIAEVPVTVEELRSSKSNLLRRVPRTLRGLWRIRRLLRREGR